MISKTQHQTGFECNQRFFRKFWKIRVRQNWMRRLAGKIAGLAYRPSLGKIDYQILNHFQLSRIT